MDADGQGGRQGVAGVVGAQSLTQLVSVFTLTAHMLLANLDSLRKFITCFFLFSVCSLRHVASSDRQSGPMWHALCGRPNGK